EDVCKGCRDNRLETEIAQCPYGVFSRTPASKVIPGNQNLRSLRHLKIRTVLEKMRTDAGFVGDFEKARRNDLIRVDVFLPHNDDACRKPHALPPNRRGSATRPSTALATAVSGDASSVRAPFPCRPSKFRLLVLTDVLPAGTESPFMAMHMLHPASRHSAPASLKIVSRPSDSACRLTSYDPGTTSIRTRGFTLRPRRSPAAFRRSDNRLFVELPIKTTSIGWPSNSWPGSSAMYRNA